MGGSQSARRVTLENPNPDPHDLNNVIRVSDSVVQRLTQRSLAATSNALAAEAAGEVTAGGDKPLIGSPEYVDAEVDRTNKYWEERMSRMQDGHKQMETIMLDEYAKAQVELEKLLPRKIHPDAKVPCTEFGAKLAKCFKKNQKESLKCLPQIDAFKECLVVARKNVIQVDDEYPDECKLRDYRAAAEKKLKERKKEASKHLEEKENTEVNKVELVRASGDHNSRYSKKGRSGFFSKNLTTGVA
ncbi:coiled-coil-helix-coiled-coil-helix domain containing [Nesidiocoris tenuis]|uniref:Coiled-coil-helix-coiled-coil-helix domain containing n=1 Tax=Nesidiocoris tenuis TaxID=355587 RepID=A0ABN7A5K7_9HEMI|nr:coiled-coil-helix-coiled-coil-helix domain containing [Nesidiocoris tenuis]